VSLLDLLSLILLFLTDVYYYISYQQKTNETKATKKVKASAGPKLIKEKDIKQPKKTKAKKSNKT